MTFDLPQAEFWMLLIFEMTSIVLCWLILLLVIPLLSALAPCSMHGPRCRVFIFSTAELPPDRGLRPLHFLQLKDVNLSLLSGGRTAP
jgi:hypothetical protein